MGDCRGGETVGGGIASCLAFQGSNRIEDNSRIFNLPFKRNGEQPLAGVNRNQAHLGFSSTLE